METLTITDITSLDAVLTRAVRNNLVCENGQIICWNCKKREALIPSLHCHGCLGEHYIKMHITDPWTVNREMTEAEREQLRVTA